MLKPYSLKQSRKCLHFFTSWTLTIDMLGVGDDKGCAYCGGLGHCITECPKLAAIQQQEAGKIGRRDFIADSAADYGH